MNIQNYNKGMLFKHYNISKNNVYFVHPIKERERDRDKDREIEKFNKDMLFKHYNIFKK